MGDVALRSATIDDYERVCELLDALDELHGERLPWLFRRPEVAARSRDYFAELLAGRDSGVLVAEADIVVGVVFVLLRQTPGIPIFNERTYAVLDGIVVADTHRRCGIGSRLVEATESWAVRHGAAWLELNVYEFNAEARGFYEALGYASLSIRLHKPLPGDA